MTTNPIFDESQNIASSSCKVYLLLFANQHQHKNKAPVVFGRCDFRHCRYQKLKSTLFARRLKVKRKVTWYLYYKHIAVASTK